MSEKTDMDTRELARLVEKFSVGDQMEVAASPQERLARAFQYANSLGHKSVSVSTADLRAVKPKRSSPDD